LTEYTDLIKFQKFYDENIFILFKKKNNLIGFILKL